MTLEVLGSDKFIGCALIRQGVSPSAPGKPSVAIATQALELHRLAHFRCPQLSVSAFVKTLSDIHSISYAPFDYRSHGNLYFTSMHSSSSKNTLPANSPLRLMSTSPSMMKLTAASRNPSAASPVIGTFTMPVQPAHTS